MSKRIIDEQKNFLFEGILSLKTVEDCYDFFEDLCTPTEIREMGKRIWAAKLISEGEKYSEIVEKTGLSTATITRVNGCLRNGSDGYVNVLSNLGIISTDKK